MNQFHLDLELFRAARQTELETAQQTAALQILCRLDVADALGASTENRLLIVLRLERALERERLRGMRKYWSYDLNRHIALKQALDRVRGSGTKARKGKRPPRSCRLKVP